MAKAQGIIGNFKGKIGNTVGYQLTSSNNKQTQGIRIYQPNVKNPKTSAQAEQRAKLAPINATYRALKMIIDRGNEGLPYGNKSRLAWLKQAFKAEHMPWFEKGAPIKQPVLCAVSKGSLASLVYSITNNGLEVGATTASESTPITTVGALSTVLLNSYSFLKAGDQITFIGTLPNDSALQVEIFSVVLDAASTEPTDMFKALDGSIQVDFSDGAFAGAVIVSREGTNGEHLRSSSSLIAKSSSVTEAPYDAASKTAAIKSYMASGAANTDWEQEPID